MKRDISTTRVSLLKQREVLITYLEMKTEVEDWHAVSDAACDLRELDVRLKILDES